MITRLVSGALLGLATLILVPPQAGLEQPFRVQDGDGYVDVETGHAAPVVADWDGDGLDDLLIGQFADGRLRVYRNLGAVGAPRFDGFEWFMADGEIASVPSG